MSDLPSEHPTLAIHLTDQVLTPLITSSAPSSSQLDALTSLTSSAFSARHAAQKAQLGRPERILVEYPDSGAVVVQTYIDPYEPEGATSSAFRGRTLALARGGMVGTDPRRRQQPRRQQQPRQRHQHQHGRHQHGRHQHGRHQHQHQHGHHQHQHGHHQQGRHQQELDDDEPPVLVGVVVAPSADETSEADLAVTTLETFGCQFQKEWAVLVEQEAKAAAAAQRAE
ncbi:hypothetical protein E4U41_004048 [Claviceps citrina]|nr:hypothetical protein E4U41_004048 [Claviceps citrina]